MKNGYKKKSWRIKIGKESWRIKEEIRMKNEKKKGWRIKEGWKGKWGTMKNENIDEKNNMENGKESWRNEGCCGIERWKWWRMKNEEKRQDIF